MWRLCFVFLLVFSPIQSEVWLNTLATTVKVNKCCELGEIFVDSSCVDVRRTNETEWKPIFINEQWQSNLPITPKIVTGYPDCARHQQWSIYHNRDSHEAIRILPSGKLRHSIYRAEMRDEFDTAYEPPDAHKQIDYDHDQGKYCMDKKILRGEVFEFALVCMQEKKTDYLGTEFLMKNIINPITHIVSIGCLLIVAIVYFVMPTLRDLVGNIISTISICLIVSQTADLIRLLTVFTSHISLLITESVCYISLLGAFFWLNSLGYYIWKTFKSRNVYLRITDSKKYCYYSFYAWSCTIMLGTLAIFAHCTMDYDTEHPMAHIEEQEQIGSLGMLIFFVPVAFTILINVFFMSTTIKILRRMNTYGRIHHKLKHSFRMFVLLFLVMSLTWLFFLMSFSKFDGLVYCYLVINAFQAPLIVYICLFNQKHVSHIMKKTCCYVDCICPCCRPEPEEYWGDEMAAMNNGIY